MFGVPVVFLTLYSEDFILLMNIKTENMYRLGLKLFT